MLYYHILESLTYIFSINSIHISSAVITKVMWDYRYTSTKTDFNVK